MDKASLVQRGLRVKNEHPLVGKRKEDFVATSSQK